MAGPSSAICLVASARPRPLPWPVALPLSMPVAASWWPQRIRRSLAALGGHLRLVRGSVRIWLLLAILLLLEAVRRRRLQMLWDRLVGSLPGLRGGKVLKAAEAKTPKSTSKRNLGGELLEGLGACFAELRQRQPEDAVRRKATHRLFTRLRMQRAQDVQVTVSLPHGPSGTTYHCTALAVDRFFFLRSVFGLSEEDFWASLCDADLQCGHKQASGKSGSLFWRSGDGRLLLKTVTAGELSTLLDGLDAYAEHFVSNRLSILCRFFAALDISAGGHRMRLVVMNNICACRLEPHVIYDLKGTTEDRWVNPLPEAVLKDLNFADRIIGVAEPRSRVDLLHVIRKDTRFLLGRNIMDYSVCLGIHYLPEDSDHHPPAEVLQGFPGINSQLGILRGFEPKFQCTLVRDQPARRVVYMIGIIDILQQYNTQKFLAHVFKSLSLGLFHEIDSVPPSYYARRFKTALLGKVQTFREPGDRVARFVKRLQAGIESGTIPQPTFALAAAAVAPSPQAAQSVNFQTVPVRIVLKQVTQALAIAPEFGNVGNGHRDVRPDTFAIGTPQPMIPSPEAVTIDEAVDFAVRCGGHLHLLRRPYWKGMRSRWEEVEAFLDMDRHALVFQTMSKDIFGRKRQASAVACYKIRRVYLSLVCHRTWNRYCMACHAPIKVEAEPVETRRFTVVADDMPLFFTAPSRRQAKLWVTALEIAAAYAEAHVEDVEDSTLASPTQWRLDCDMSPSPHSLAGSNARMHSLSAFEAGVAKSTAFAHAAVLGSLDRYLQEGDRLRASLVSRSARFGMLEPYLLGPEAERRWEKRRVKWIFGFVDIDGTGCLNLAQVKTLWSELNISTAEGGEVLWKFLKEDRDSRRYGGGRQIGGGRAIRLQDFRRMLHSVDMRHVRTVRAGIANEIPTVAASAGGGGGSASGGGGEPRRRRSISGRSETSVRASPEDSEDTISAEAMAQFFAEVQHVSPPPSTGQVRRLLARLQPPLITHGRWLTPTGASQLLCSPSNSLIDPAMRLIFQDMKQPLASYFIETSHNTYLEGNQLSSRSSVLRYVEVLRHGCRSVEVDCWDGADGEPVVRHGYTLTTGVLFEDVINAIADHAFIASDFPVIISIEQHCCASQRTRQVEILERLLGSRLLKPPWDEAKNDIDYESLDTISPWSARGRFIVKSSRGCCERCSRPLPNYDRGIFMPTVKLSKQEKAALQSGSFLMDGLEDDEAGAQEPMRHSCDCTSMTADKVLKLRKSTGEDALRRFTARYLTRAYPESTRIGSGNMDPVPLWNCGVQMVALNYQTPDQALLLNEGMFRSYNGGCGYVLKPPSGSPAGSSCCMPRRRLRLRVVCGHRLPRPEAPLPDAIEVGDVGQPSQATAVSSPLVAVCLEPGGQASQTRAVMYDGYHPFFNHEVDFTVCEAPFHILTFEVRDSPSSRTIAHRAVRLDAVREGFRWLALRSSLGTTVRHGGLLVHVQFLAK